MSREEAISLLMQVNKILVNSNSWLENTHEPLNMAFDMAIKALEQESRKGHWIEHDWKEMHERGYYRCSVCNCGYQRYKKGIRKSDVPYIDGKEYTLRSIDNYCPNCGADMREVEDGNDD